MAIRLKAVTADGEVRLMLPEGRHLERGGWFVAADVITSHPRLLALRAWTPSNNGFRVIVLDELGTEYDSMRAPTYDQAKAAMASLNGASVSHPAVDGRRLVSGGDAGWEIAAEVRHVDGEEVLFVRVWIHSKQEFSVYAIDVDRLVRGRHRSDLSQGRRLDRRSPIALARSRARVRGGANRRAPGPSPRRSWRDSPLLDHQLWAMPKDRDGS